LETTVKREVATGHLPAVIAGFSGWLLDSFDFFLVTFCLTAIARDFHKSDAQKVGWAQHAREITSHWKLFLYLLIFMTMMLFASHGTLDMYPTFLQREWHFSPGRRSAITAFSAVGAILGGVIIGHLSDKWGRRRAMITAFVLGILLIPIWAYAPNQGLLIAGAFFMQFMVQGAWGVIPAHLAELSPNSVRAFLPGFAYQSAGTPGQLRRVR
jgi:SHS family lactate transporter-like MFS transporter